jgi:hypothetical protein
MADPTNARMRTLNSFFDSPRFTIRELPAIGDEPVTEHAPAPVATAPPVTAPLAAVPPVLTVALQPAAKRTLKAFLADGLLVKVTSNRPLVDVEARIFEVLSTGALRPLGSAFRAEPGPDGASLRIEATRFARSRLKRGKGGRSVQLKVTGVGRDGLAGTASSSFHLR